jgi:catechol 2,3-dioxygenase-like lactoylglutathione lyase family enzyme
MMDTSRREFLSGLSGACALGGLTACAATAEQAPSLSSDADPATLVRGIAYIGQSVSDLEATTRYYTSTGGLSVVAEGGFLGGRQLARIEGMSAPLRSRLIRGASGQIRIMEFQMPSRAAREAGVVPVQGPGITHVCHQSHHDKGLWKRFVDAGARPVSRTGDLVQLRADVPVLYGYARDADGTMLEVEQILAEGLEWSYRMRHVAICVRDIDRTVAFYTALLGRSPRERRSNLMNPTLDTTADLDNVKLDVAWYNLVNLELEIWEYISHPAATPAAPRPLAALGYNMIVFDVANAGRAAERLVAAGGTLVSGAATIDAGVMAFGRDPDGNLLGLLEVDAGSAYSTIPLGTLQNG